MKQAIFVLSVVLGVGSISVANAASSALATSAKYQYRIDCEGKNNDIKCNVGIDINADEVGVGKTECVDVSSGRVASLTYNKFSTFAGVSMDGFVLASTPEKSAEWINILKMNRTDMPYGTLNFIDLRTMDPNFIQMEISCTMIEN